MYVGSVFSFIKWNTLYFEYSTSSFTEHYYCENCYNVTKETKRRFIMFRKSLYSFFPLALQDCAFFLKICVYLLLRAIYSHFHNSTTFTNASCSSVYNLNLDQV